MKRIDIQGRRWFQRSAGNTYHSVRVLVDGMEVAYLPFQYGYGEQYLDTAFRWLEDNKYVNRDQYENGGTEAPFRWAERVGVELHYAAEDVERKRDL